MKKRILKFIYEKFFQAEEKQKQIEFARWLASNAYPIQGSNNLWHLQPLMASKFTTEELYEMFIREYTELKPIKEKEKIMMHNN